ncbi:MAG: type II secretion system F family protein [Bacillota bacterium]|nr:type II secretion system F family protein [Bacillota bacterium]
MDRKKELSPENIAAFCRQMEMVLRSGVTYEEGLNIILLDSAKGPVGRATQELLTLMEDRSFPQAVADSGFFPSYVVKMINIGSVSGCLDRVMSDLANFYQHRRTVQRNIRAAVSFPLVMAVLMFSVIILLVVKVMPMFYRLMSGFAIAPSSFAAGLMKIGSGLSNNAMAISVVVLIILIGYLILSRFPVGHVFFDFLRRKLLGNVYGVTDTGNFCSALAMMLRSGLDIQEAVELAADVVEDRKLAEAVKKFRDKIGEGEDFASAAASSQTFNNIQTAIIALGAKTGNLEVVLEHIAEDCAVRADERMSTLLSVVEPAIVAVFSILLAMILLSVILPLMGVMTSL